MKNWYLKYVIKKPYFYFLFIVIGIMIIWGLLITTTVPVVKTYPVELNQNHGEYLLTCNEPIFSTDIRSIFLYSDKNNAINQITNYNVVNNKQISVTHDLSGLISVTNSTDYYIDISKNTVTLLNEIFIQGGEN